MTLDITIPLVLRYARPNKRYRTKEIWLYLLTPCQMSALRQLQSNPWSLKRRPNAILSFLSSQLDFNSMRVASPQDYPAYGGFLPAALPLLHLLSSRTLSTPARSWNGDRKEPIATFLRAYAGAYENRHVFWFDILAAIARGFSLGIGFCSQPPRNKVG